MPDDSESLRPWSPQPGPQTDAITADWCDELLYGGAAGGGKSDYLLGDFLQDVPTYGQAWRGILLRRTYPELEELIARSFELYPSTGATWTVDRKTWTWPNGATLKLRYLEREQDATRYQGHQYTWEGWDELTQWATLFAYKYLRARLRSAHQVPRKRIRATANPGGAGHHMVKAYFIDPAPAGYVPRLDAETGHHVMFIPSRLSDNQILLRSDPGYAGRLRGLGSPELVRAWLEGDWSVITGAYFPEFSIARHVVAPVELPARWVRFRSFDWGSARPFSVGWWAVSDGTLSQFPKGALVCYREWYGMAEGQPNTGLRLKNEQIGEGIASRERGDDITYAVADPSAFKEDGGPSHMEGIGRGGAGKWRPADNTRIPGWAQVRARLLGEDGRPMIYWFSTCAHSIRTLPALQHDENKPEDVDSEGEDHAGDQIRYACMSRPYARPAPPKEPPTAGDNQVLVTPPWDKPKKPAWKTRARA